MKYSVVIPMYNCGAFINKTLDSIKGQIHKDIELVLVNDGSTDNTEDVVNNYINTNKNMDIKYYCIENSGPGKARNVGIDHASGDYICFLDSDDQFDINLFAELDNVIEKDIDICYFGWIEIDEDGKPFSYYNSRFKFIEGKVSGVEAAKMKFHKTLWLCNCNEVYRLSFLKKHKIRYIEGVFSGEDTNFIYKCLVHASYVGCLPKNYFLNTYRKESLMHHSFSTRYLTEFIALDELNIYAQEQRFDDELLSMLYALYYCARINVSKKIIRSQKWYHPFRARKMMKTMIPKIKKRKGLPLTRKEKLECRIFSLSKILFFYFVKTYYAFHR